MTTNASARHPMPPSRNASGVEPPLTAATPDTLSSMAMPGASTETEIAMASGRRSAPWASSPLAVLVSRSGSILAIVRPPHSVELEVLAHLPVADLLALRRRVLGHGRVMPGQFGPLHLDQVVDQRVAERLAEESVLLERVDAGGESSRRIPSSPAAMLAAM